MTEGAVEFAAFHFDLGQTRADFGVHGAVGREVQQAVFGGIEALELGLEVALRLPSQALLVGEGVSDAVTQRPQKLSIDVEAPILGGNAALDQLDGQVRQVANAFLASATQVVGVGAALPARLGVDQARRSAVPVAAVTEQETFQIVVVHPVTLAAERAGVHDRLDAAEQR